MSAGVICVMERRPLFAKSRGILPRCIEAAPFFPTRVCRLWENDAAKAFVRRIVVYIYADRNITVRKSRAVGKLEGLVVGRDDVPPSNRLFAFSSSIRVT